MNGELRLSRSRWWGTWVILGVILLGWGSVVVLALQQGTRDMFEAARGTTILSVPLMLLAYAPWTFFPIARLLGLVIFYVSTARLLEASDLVDRLVALASGDTPARALRGFLVYGIPGLAVALLRVPPTCPYDDRGRPRAFEHDVVVRLEHLEPSEDPGSGSIGLRRVKAEFDYVACPRAIESGDGPHPRLRIVLPADRLGDAILADWTRRLAEAGLRPVIVERRAGTRSLVSAMIAGVYERRWFGRRVRAPRTTPSESRAS